MAIIAIVGVDGCGKTTQAKMLVSRLKGEGYNAVYVQPVTFLKSILFGLAELSVSPRKRRTSDELNKNTFINFILACLGLMYALVTVLILKFIGIGKLIICDRYFYHFFFDLFGDKYRIFVRLLPKPDIVIFLDADIDLLYKRMDLFDARVERGYYVNVIRMYRELSCRYGFIKLDACEDKLSLSDVIYGIVSARYKNRKI